MGSRARHSSRPSKAAASPSRSRKSNPRAPKPRRKPTDFDALLVRFSDGLSLVATAARSLGLAQENLETISDYDVGDDIYTLARGLKALRNVYNELDVGIREVRQ